MNTEKSNPVPTLDPNSRKPDDTWLAYHHYVQRSIEEENEKLNKRKACPYPYYPDGRCVDEDDCGENEEIICENSHLLVDDDFGYDDNDYSANDGDDNNNDDDYYDDDNYKSSGSDEDGEIEDFCNDRLNDTWNEFHDNGWCD